MASTNYKIVPCELSDMAVCADIFDEAFADDPAMIYLHPRSDPNVLKEKSIQNFEKSFSAPGVKYFKVILEGSSEIVAFSKWVYPHIPDPNAEDPEKAIRTQQHIPGSNDKLVVEFFIKFLRGRKKWVVPETHYFMSILAVRPEYQRKGLGSMLLAPVLEQADRENAKAFVQGSAQGIGLYLKHGWEEVDEILMDYSPYGGSKDVKTTLLLREPRKFGRKFNRNENEIVQACNLAAGYSDVVVILERPAKHHDYDLDFDEFVTTCDTLNAVDKFIKFATNETRSIENVSVFDALSFKPFASATRPSNDECYSLLENMLKTKKPKVVICCWSDRSAKCNNDFVKHFLGGGFQRQSRWVTVNTEWDPSLAVVRSFHPSTAVNFKKYNPDYQILLIYHFIAAFSKLGQSIQEPLWLEDISSRCIDDIRSEENDDIDELSSDAKIRRAISIIYNILGKDQSQIDSIKLPSTALYLSLWSLKRAPYERGSTAISKLYIIWEECFKDHTEYEWGLAVLLDIANKQERLDPVYTSGVTKMTERLKNCRISASKAAPLIKPADNLEVGLLLGEAL
ncbi:hypothetical protein V492_08317 [Pseudogymnoascus sp. VKM F-4246]|nr:hypothetical protein V492_08317 [Pseudogymnoascus sp. VKM F-4246]